MVQNTEPTPNAKTKPKSVVWICSYLPIKTGAGVERFVMLLSNCLSATGRTCKVVDLDSAGIKSKILQASRYYVAWKIGKIVNKSASPDDIIVCNNFFSWNAKRGRSLVVYHGTEAGRVRGTHAEMGLLRHALVRTVGVQLDKRVGYGRLRVAVAEETKREIETYYDHQVTAVIPNAVDLDLFRPASPSEKEALRSRLKLPVDKFLVLFVGTKDPRKGLPWIFEKIVPKLPPSHHLVVRANVDAAPSGVTVVERLSIPDLADLYRACDVFLFPTKYEGCSFTLLEALACGLPVVTSPAGSGADLLADAALKTGIVEGFKEEEYLRLLESLRTSEAERSRVGRAARSWAESNYALPVFEKSYIGLIERIEGMER